jgi:hypothetical protein
MNEMRLSLPAHVILERDADDGEVVLIDTRSGRMSACNETATVIVDELARGATIDRLVAALTRRFATTETVAVRDVNALLDALAAEGLLEAKG